MFEKILDDEAGAEGFGAAVGKIVQEAGAGRGGGTALGVGAEQADVVGDGRFQGEVDILAVGRRADAEGAGGGAAEKAALLLEKAVAGAKLDVPDGAMDQLDLLHARLGERIIVRRGESGDRDLGVLVDLIGGTAAGLEARQLLEGGEEGALLEEAALIGGKRLAEAEIGGARAVQRHEDVDAWGELGLEAHLRIEFSSVRSTSLSSNSAR